MRIELREEPFDRAGDLLAAFASEIAELYPGWHPGVGPTAQPHDFEPPSGGFVVAYAEEGSVGCGGVKWLDHQTAEVKRLYVAPDVRGSHWLEKRLTRPPGAPASVR